MPKKISALTDRGYGGAKADDLIPVANAGDNAGIRPPCVVVRLASDVTNNTTSFADVTGLSFAVKNGVWYAFRFLFLWQSDATTTGIGFSVNGPTASVVVHNTLIAQSTSGNGFSYQRAYDDGNATASIDTANASTLSVMDGIVHPTADGTLIARVKAEVPTTVTIKAGSIGILYPCA